MKRLLTSLTGLIILLAPPTAYATNVTVYCGDLPGCPGTGFVALNQLRSFFPDLLTEAYIHFNVWGYLLGGLFIMIGGARMVLSAGNEESVTKGRQTIIWALIGIFLANFAQQIVDIILLESNPNNHSLTVGPDMLSILIIMVKGTIFSLLNISLTGVALLSGMRMVLSQGKDEEMKKGRDGLIYAAVGAVIINVAEAFMSAFVNL